jgi:ribosomal protein L25 (general stress protein Ctc)
VMEVLNRVEGTYALREKERTSLVWTDVASSEMEAMVVDINFIMISMVNDMIDGSIE